MKAVVVNYSPERKYLHLHYNHGKHGRIVHYFPYFPYSVFSVLSVVKLSLEIGEEIWGIDYNNENIQEIFI